VRITDGLPGTRFDGQTTAALWFRNDNFGARLVLDDLLATQCGPAMDPGFADACRVLAAWDRTSQLDAPGAALFREFWRRMTALPPIPGNAFFAVPFNAAEPIDTPRGLKSDAATVALVATQLKAAIDTLQSQGVALNATLRQLQISSVGPRKLPVPGGEEFEGVANKVISGPLHNGRYTAFAGTTYLQAVALGAPNDVLNEGRTSNARGFLVFGQSSDQRSPFFGDQMEYFSASVLRPLPDLR
jgi:acyl-homoserine-lactone acylase